MGLNGSSHKISTRDIDQILLEHTEAELSLVKLEVKLDKNHEHLYIHLPNKTLVYDGIASKELGTHVWFTLTSSLTGDGQYRAKNFVYCYDKWLVGDPLSISHGYFTNTLSSHNDIEIGWDFGTTIAYNEGNGAIFHELELVALTGRSILGDNPTIWTSYSLDGEIWSIEKPISAGKQGQRDKRLAWLQQGNMKNWRIQRFRGTSKAHISIARLEARIESLSE
jgi:hypothetical protein